MLWGFVLFLCSKTKATFYTRQPSKREFENIDCGREPAD